MQAIYPGASRMYTPRHSGDLRYLCISGHLPSPSPFPSTRYLHSAAVAQSSAKLSGGGGETRIFPPHRHLGKAIVHTAEDVVYLREAKERLDRANVAKAKMRQEKAAAKVVSSGERSKSSKHAEKQVICAK